MHEWCYILALVLWFMLIRALIYGLSDRVPILYWLQERRHKRLIITRFSRGQPCPATIYPPTFAFILRIDRPISILLRLIVPHLGRRLHLPYILL